MSAMVIRAGDEVRVFTESFTAGSDPGCDLVIGGDQYVSSRHARFIRAADGWYVTDLGSTNGTWLNDQTATGARSWYPQCRVTGAALLRRGDRVRAGETILTVVPV